MKIEAIGEEKILVMLSLKDMNELDITYAEMDYSNIETRRVIWTILDEAKRHLGKSLDTDGKILIEVTESDDGGCIMCFTSMPFTDIKSKKKLVMKKDVEPIVFKALNNDSFLESFKLLNGKNELFKSFDIYSFKNKLYFIIQPKISTSTQIAYILSDFGELYFNESSLLNAITEYGKPLSFLKA